MSQDVKRPQSLFADDLMWGSVADPLDGTKTQCDSIFGEIGGLLCQPRSCVSQAARWTLPVTRVGIPTEVLVSEAIIPVTSQSIAQGHFCLSHSTHARQF